MPHASKSELRSTLRAKRAAVPADERPLLAHNAAEQAGRLLKPSDRIALYYATEEELGTLALAESLWREGKSVYLPVINDNRVLSFRLWTPYTKLTASRLHTWEPVASDRDLTAEELDVIVIPLVGFARDGARLGMGGGFYDSTLKQSGANLNTEANTDTKNHIGLEPLKVGFAYDIQEAENIPTEAHDVALDYVVTPTRIIDCATSNTD